jgi:Transposase DNA-binding/Transposase Tn5 dimerisation domain
LNITTIHQELPLAWAEKHFAEVDLGETRRNQRTVTIAAAMAANPDKSIPKMFIHGYDIKAAYKFFSHPEATPDHVQLAHRELVLEQMRLPGRYLLLEDSSEMSWSGKNPIPGLGPIGPGASGLQGFHLHSVLAVRWACEVKQTEHWPGRPAVEVLGLPAQHYHVRKRRPKGEPANNSKVIKQRKRESEWWTKAGEMVSSAPEDEQVAWTRVCDRGADIYEMLISCGELDHRFVIRAAQDRCLTNEEGRAITGKLFATVRAQASMGEFTLELRARPRQAARTAQLKVSAVEVWLRAPQRPRKGPGYLPPVRCNAVRIWEADPPPGVEALEWILLTDWPVESYAQALEVALAYSTRWLIEEFHKALKTGTKAEELQLETAESLFAAIAIKSIVALRLLDLRERVQLSPDAPAEQAGLNELELAVLRKVLNRPIKTVREVALAIGRLGGHMNRKGDGMPGWQTLFSGMAKLNNLVDGARIAFKLKKFG